MLRLLALCLFATIVSQPREKEVAEIGQQIDQLQALQERYRSSAQRSINDAMRWQFQNENYLDARRAWDKVAQDKQKIREIEDQIEDLKNRQDRLINKQGDGTHDE